MRARIPADIDMADRILGGFTARQVAIVGAGVLALWGIWFGIGRHISPVLFALIAAPVAAIGLLWATTSVEGTSAERVAVAATRYLSQPRHHVLAPEGVVSLPAWWRPESEPIAPLTLPARSVDTDGVVALGHEGSAVVCSASSVNFALRSEAEQRALVDGFGRVLNSLDTPMQFVVRSQRTDIRATLRTLQERAATLPSPELEQAALEHARFLAELSSRADVLSRRVLVCVRSNAGEGAAAVLERRVEEAATLLRGLGIKLHRLGGTEVAEALAHACDPSALPDPAAGVPVAVVRGR